jgi:plasmid maintenance system antidote protein VapI
MPDGHSSSMADIHPLQAWLDEPGKERTQVALAKAAGVTQPFISRLISGERNCDPDNAERISKATDGAVSVEDLIFFWRRQHQAQRDANDAA